jgi:hypothetical protein
LPALLVVLVVGGIGMLVLAATHWFRCFDEGVALEIRGRPQRDGELTQSVRE